MSGRARKAEGRAVVITRETAEKENIRVGDQVTLDLGMAGKDEWQVVGLYEPVFVGGTTVSNATLHNLFELRRKGVRVGDQVIVRRAGDVIPEVVGRMPGARTAYVPNFAMPTNCPVCSSKVERDKDLDVIARIEGGGVSGQAGALRLGIARALIDLDPELRPVLKKEGYLSRDAREKERRKYGLKKARKAPQYSKR